MGILWAFCGHFIGHFVDILWGILWTFYGAFFVNNVFGIFLAKVLGIFVKGCVDILFDIFGQIVGVCVIIFRVIVVGILWAFCGHFSLAFC